MPVASIRWWLIVVVAFVVSSANSLQSRVNGAASVATDDPIVAAMMSVGGGFVSATVLLLVFPGARRAALNLFSAKARETIKWWQYFAGFGGGIFIFGQAYVVPAYGVSLYIISVVTGQTLASLWVDHVGLGPAGRQLVSRLRVLAALLAIAGVILAAFGRDSELGVGLAAVSYGLFAGVATSIQYALNGRIGSAVSSALVTSSLNFAMGFSLLTVMMLIRWVSTSEVPGGVPSLITSPELWLGGPLGLLFIGSATLFVRHLGVLIFSVVSVLGQLAGALVLDVIYPTSGTHISGYLYVGLALVALGVILGGLGRAVGPARATDGTDSPANRPW